MRQIQGQEVVEVQLLDLLLEVNKDIDTQFQVWISITFAVLVASFVAGKRLTGGARFAIAALYICAAVILYLRYMRGALDYIPYVYQLFITYGAPVPQGSSQLAFDLRRVLFLFGSAVTSLAVLFPQLGHRDEARDRRMDPSADVAAEDDQAPEPASPD
jgi:hypothetical protein